MLGRHGGNSPLHHQHNEHPWSFHTALRAAAPRFSLCSLSKLPKNVARAEVATSELWDAGAPRRELGEPMVPIRQGLLSPAGSDGCPQQAGIAACTGIPQQLQPTSQKHGSLGQGPGVSQAERIHGEWEGKRVGA